MANRTIRNARTGVIMIPADGDKPALEIGRDFSTHNLTGEQAKRVDRAIERGMILEQEAEAKPAKTTKAKTEGDS